MHTVRVSAPAPPRSLLLSEQGLDSIHGSQKIEQAELCKRSWQRSLGYVPQQIYLSDASISSNIAFGIDPKKIDLHQIKNVAKTANLHNFIVKLPYGYNTIIGERGVRFSGCERQRQYVSKINQGINLSSLPFQALYLHE